MKTRRATYRTSIVRGNAEEDTVLRRVLSESDERLRHKLVKLIDG